jgi:hypothetical protein
MRAIDRVREYGTFCDLRIAVNRPGGDQNATGPVHAGSEPVAFTENRMVVNAAAAPTNQVFLVIVNLKRDDNTAADK